MRTIELKQYILYVVGGGTLILSHPENPKVHLLPEYEEDSRRLQKVKLQSTMVVGGIWIDSVRVTDFFFH